MATGITFNHIERGGSFIFISPQLPGWKCSAPTRAIAERQVFGSLKSYLRNERNIPQSVRDDLVKMVGPG